MRSPLPLLLIVPALCAFKAEGPVSLDAPETAPPLSNYMEDRMSGDPYVDHVPTGLQRSVVEDQARITSLSRGRACFEVVTRTNQRVEENRGGYVFKVNKTEVWPEGEPKVEVFEYTFEGTRTVLDLSAFTDAGSGRLRLTEPTKGTVRVVQRTFQVCGKPGVKKGRVDLHVMLKPRVIGESALIERYRWHVR